MHGEVHGRQVGSQDIHDFFGQLKEVIGTESIEVTLPLGSTIGDLITRFEIPVEGNSGIRIAADGNIGAPLDLVLRDGSEIAFLPPSSGG